MLDMYNMLHALQNSTSDSKLRIAMQKRAIYLHITRKAFFRDTFCNIKKVVYVCVKRQGLNSL